MSREYPLSGRILKLATPSQTSKTDSDTIIQGFSYSNIRALVIDEVRFFGVPKSPSNLDIEPSDMTQEYPLLRIVS